MMPVLKNLRLFVLEDDPARIHLFREASIGWAVVHIATSVEEAKKLWTPPYDLVCLDHDLGGEQMVDSTQENTGYQFALWLAERPIEDRDETIVVHSYNPEGAKRMLVALREHRYAACRVPFGLTVLGLISDATKNL